MSECNLDTNAVALWRRAPPRTNIQPLSLTYEQAVDLVEYSLAASDHRIWRLKRSLYYEKKLRGGKPEMDLLIEYFNLFSKTFFLGTLTAANCSIELICKEDSRWAENQESQLKIGGFAAHRPPEARSEICLFEMEITDSNTQFFTYLQMLAHEMTYSFLQINVCQCQHSCGRSGAAKKGVTGHGLPWQKCAQKVEEFLKKSWICRVLHPWLSSSVGRIRIPQQRYSRTLDWWRGR